MTSLPAQGVPPAGKNEHNDSRYVWFAMRIMVDFGATLALPVVFLAWLGRRLDSRHGTSPWLTIAGFALAAFISGYVIWKKAKRYGREYEALDAPHTTIKPE